MKNEMVKRKYSGFIFSAVLLSGILMFTSCGSKGRSVSMEQGMSAKGTANYVESGLSVGTSDTADSADVLSSVGADVSDVTESVAEVMSTDENGNIVIDTSDSKVKLKDNGDGTQVASIIRDDGSEVEVVVKKDDKTGKMVVDTSKDITVTVSAGTSTPTVTAKVEVDKSGKVTLQPTETMSKPTSSTAPTEPAGSDDNLSVPTPTAIVTVAAPTQPVITAKPTEAPKPTQPPKPTDAPEPTQTVAPEVSEPEECQHKNMVTVTETKTVTTPAWDEEIKQKIGTEQCRGCGQYEIDFIEAWDAHDTDKLVEYYLTGHTQNQIDTFWNQANKYGLEWLVYDSGDGTCHEFFIGHCSDCNGGSNWGSCNIQRVVDVIHHDAVTTTDEVTVGIYCDDCKIWIWREDGNLNAPAP